MSTDLQKQLDEMRVRAETAEARLNSITGMERTRLAEINFKAGFDKGIEFQKKAAPTPKAKQYRDALKELVATFGASDAWEHGTPEHAAIAKAEGLLR